MANSCSNGFETPTAYSLPSTNCGAQKLSVKRCISLGFNATKGFLSKANLVNRQLLTLKLQIIYFFTALNESLTPLYTDPGPGIVYFWSEKCALCTCFKRTLVAYIGETSSYYWLICVTKLFWSYYGYFIHKSMCYFDKSNCSRNLYHNI